MGFRFASIGASRNNVPETSIRPGHPRCCLSQDESLAEIMEDHMEARACTGIRIHVCGLGFKD